MPLIYPALSLRNRTPSSTPCGSGSAATAGVAVLVQMLQGHAENGRAFDTLPSGLATVTWAVPAAAMSAAVIAAVSWLALPYVVTRPLPFHRTLAPLTKFEPVTVSVNPGPPACAELGDKAPRVGGGGALVM